MHSPAHKQENDNNLNSLGNYVNLGSENYSVMKIPCPSGRVGSSPTFGTNLIQSIYLVHSTNESGSRAHCLIKLKYNLI